MGNGVLLDTNCFSHVFNRNDKSHEEFSDFLDWLCYGQGYLVYGGTKYINELKKTENYLRIFRLLNDCNKTIAYDTTSIDLEQERITRLVNDPKFDDPHLPAIIVISKCRVICSVDERSFPYLKRKDIYEGKAKRPKFYTGKHNAQLLSPTYVGKPHTLKKVDSKLLLERIEVAISKKK